MGMNYPSDICPHRGLGTSGPDSFKGPIAKRCKEKIHLKDIVNFDIISTSLVNLDEHIWTDLLRDEKLLY